MIPFSKVVKQVTAIENGLVSNTGIGSGAYNNFMAGSGRVFANFLNITNRLNAMEGVNFVGYSAPNTKPVGVEKYAVESVDGDRLVLTIEVYEE